MPRKKYKEVVEKLLANGWEHVRTNGSHEIYRNKKTGVSVPIKCTSKEIPAGTVSSIQRITGLKF
ncbi:type II toxin-antitoxin system HicA family toxin [Peptoniphilus pacaensis]|uniref:type II toxin-antitoxin system HicA family toxin n=1 Tax=Peptoniphilaceae TaxID=1570339 RepID=UPI000838093A|nr:type II toxin-antitoxin system HicA family toxin [Peptoniphilus pacaensis]